MKINRNKWQSDFEKELDKAEKRQLSKVKNYYITEYNKGVASFLAEGQTNFQLLFDSKDLQKIYRDLYLDIGLQFAKWYAKNYDKYISKGINPSEYIGEWTNKFAAFGSAVGAKRVTLVSGTAKETLIKITQQLFQDPEFMTLGNTEKGRILKSQFNRYSTYQSERLVRTEATNAANFATMESATTIFPGAQMQKEWIASFDDRTRDTHAEVGASEPIPYNDAFMVGGNFLMYPGDPSGPSSEVINCRCSVAPFPVRGAQASTEITDISFGIGGANTTGFGLGDVASFIGSTASAEIKFEPFDDINKLQDFSTEYFKNFNPNNTFNIDLKGIDLDVANRQIEQLYKLTKEYKISDFYGILSDDLANVGAKVSRIYPSKDAYLEYNVNVFKNSKKLNNTEKSLIDNNFITRVNDLNRDIATTTHEFSHLFGTSNRKVKQSKEWWSFKNKLSKLFKEYKNADILMSTDVNFISQYAKTNVDEFMAESFAMYKLNKNPSKYAVKVGRLIDEYFKI